MDGQVYKKKGRRYIPIGYSDGFTGFPSEGLWVVYDKPGMKTCQCIARVGEFKPIDYELLMQLTIAKENDCVSVVQKIRDKGMYTTADIVRSIFETLLIKQ